MTTASNQGQLLRRLPPRSSAETTPAQSSTDERGRAASRALLLPKRALTRQLGKASRQERALERERQRDAQSLEAAKDSFFQTPAGRARLAYKRGHQLFQYELAVNDLEPVVVPGPVGSPARETVDPVDILNSVSVEGWKLVTGKFFYSDLRNGAVGCYLFKRSQKRRLPMNNPWQDLARLQRLSD